VHGCDEALAIIDAYEPPDEPAVEARPRRVVRHGATEPPPRMLYHRYALDHDGTILDARIVPPTSQNRLVIEEDLRAVVQRSVELPDEELRLPMRAGDPQPPPVHLLRHPLPGAGGAARVNRCPARSW
jgi:sulfhydrogenase subunit alpha